MSMDGKNRTVIVNEDNSGYYDDAILSFTLDYPTQILYWSFYDHNNHTLSFESSYADGSNRQILQLIDADTIFYDYYYLYRYPSSLGVYKQTLFFSVSWRHQVYKLELARGENLVILFNSSAICGNKYYQIKVAKQQPAGEIWCNYMCTDIHFVLIVDQRYE